jgi:hypothetical protein
MERAGTVLSMPHVRVLPQSIVEEGGAEWALGEEGGAPRLVIALTSAPRDLLDRFEGVRGVHDGHAVLVGPLTAANAAALRSQLAHLAPRPLGLRTSFGFGDRLGVATPGHVHAMRRAGHGISPIYAQQSARELVRTGRTSRDVLDAATWGAFREGWTAGVGADADHLKTEADIDAYLDAGFTMFTIDPGEHVDQVPGHAAAADLRALVDALPWEPLEDRPTSLLARYSGRRFDVDATRLVMDEQTLLRAAIKYGRALVHVTRLYRHLVRAAGPRPFELEVSVDETDAPTSPLEHLYVASELRRLGVVWVSLAPRLVGSFEKGVDYIGDHAQFDADWAIHAAIARTLGPYKLSLHSGSDKFSIYESVAQATGGMVHVKTAGTSWLEALRAVAVVDPGLFRDIYAFARDRYGTDRASYHVSGRVESAPAPGALSDAELPALLDDFHARQILHVTFGSVLTASDSDGQPRFRARLMAVLAEGEAVYAANLEAHFVRHLEPFSRATQAKSNTL